MGRSPVSSVPVTGVIVTLEAVTLACRIKLADPWHPGFGRFLVDFDVDARGGRGTDTWSADPALAMVFVDSVEAWQCWRRQSAVQPLRDDGKPNRPLTAYTIEIEPIP
ncbi:MAG TPA: hypothetical protein VGG68_00985 [Caulobacteraceae bacterium]